MRQQIARDLYVQPLHPHVSYALSSSYLHGDPPSAAPPPALLPQRQQARGLPVAQRPRQGGQVEQEGRDHAVVAPVLRAVPSVAAAVVAGDVPAAAVPVRPPAAVQVAAVLARGVAEEAAEEAGEELRELNYIRFLCRFTSHRNYKCFPYLVTIGSRQS